MALNKENVFKNQLHSIASVRLPIIIAIVSCHVMIPCEPNTIEWYLIKFIGHETASIGVHLFFFISGLLFFANINKDTNNFIFIKEIWPYKIKKRVTSILIPYLCWNLIAYIFYAIIDKHFEWTLLFSHKVYWDWNYEVKGFFFYPADGPLWFLRNLFIISLITPFIYLIIKLIPPKIGVCLLSISYILNIGVQYDFGMINTFCLFTMGAYWGYYKITSLDKIYNLGKLCLILFIIISIIDLYISNIYQHHEYLQHIGILIGFPVMFFLSRNLPSSYKNIDFPSLSMFIFCSHGFLLRPILFITNKLNISYPLITYVLNIVLTSLLCIISYYLMKQFFPKKISKILMGGRI